MKVSKEAIEGIKKDEGVRTKPYRCPALLWTVGVGHVIDTNHIRVKLDERKNIPLPPEAEDDLYQQLVERYGKEKADYEWKDIQAIKERQMKEVKEGRDELGRDLKKLRELKIMCFIASLIIVTTYYIFKGHL